MQTQTAIRMVLETITPEKAAEYLRRAGENRPLSQGTVRFISEALRQGRAQTTHQGIAFDTNGRLIDGQHRLTAIIETGISWQMWVAYDCPPEIFNVIDIGKHRTVGDLLSIRGFKNGTTLAAVGKLAWCWELGRASFSGTPRDDQIADLVRRYPSLSDLEIIRADANLGLPLSAVTFIGYIAESDEFMADLLLEAPDPTTPGGMAATIYRERRKARKSRNRRFDFAVMVKARNDHHNGVSPTKRYSHRDAQAFPTPEWNVRIAFGAKADEADEE